MKKWTIRKFAAHVGVEIKGRLVRYPEYEYDGDGTKVYADDRCDKSDCVCFWIKDGHVEIHCFDTDKHYDSNDY